MKRKDISDGKKIINVDVELVGEDSRLTFVLGSVGLHIRANTRKICTSG